MVKGATNTRWLSKNRAPNRRNRKRREKSRILFTIIRGNREWQYHATKGWRNYRRENVGA